MVYAVGRSFAAFGGSCTPDITLACRQSLVDDLLEFSQSYDLHGSGYTYREEQAKRRIGVLQEEVMLLEAGGC